MRPLPVVAVSACLLGACNSDRLPRSAAPGPVAAPVASAFIHRDVHLLRTGLSHLLKTQVKAQEPSIDGRVVFVGAFYRMVHESQLVSLGQRKVRLRVWGSQAQSWPGPPRPQVIQVLDADDMLLAARKVGGQPAMTDVWSAEEGGRLFVCIKCKHRNRLADGVYAYEVAPDLGIRDAGVEYDAEGLAEEQRRADQLAQRVRELVESRKSAQPSEGTGAAMPSGGDASDSE